MEGVCTQEGYLVLLGDSGRDPDREKKLVKMLRAKQVDGVVMIPNQEPMQLVELLQQARIPSVILEHELPGQHCITIDDLEGGRLGTEHLLSLGHRHIGLIRRTPSSASSSQRCTGYRQALDEAGVGFNPDLVIESGPGQEAGSRSMQRLLALPQPPTAVFTHNDVLAMGAMHAIRSAGLSIPDHISVVGYDDTAPAAYLGPPMTTVRFPKEEMGRRAGELILRLAQHKDELPPRTLTLPVKLLVRASTAPPPG
jgi:LacI family repressor for deo operon, udp, cdd, tsx, nupC, and nupG